MRVAVLQSNYIPWKGYFNIIGLVDLFIFYDDVQFTKNDWRNRNKIKTAQGTQWLTIPAGQNINRKINEVILPDAAWQEKHWRTLQQNYAKAPFFQAYRPLIEPIYLARRWDFLSELNQELIRQISLEGFGFKTEFKQSTEFGLSGDRNARLLMLLKAVGATTYISGASARAYIDTNLFTANGIAIEYMQYDHYPVYDQLYPPFEHAVTALDLLWMAGANAAKLINLNSTNAANP